MAETHGGAESNKDGLRQLVRRIVDLTMGTGSDDPDAKKAGETELREMLPALKQAAREGNLEPFRALAQPEPDGASFLMWAALEGHTDLVRALIAAGADPRAGGPMNVTPLGMAADRGHADVVEALIEAGADVNVRFLIGTPLGDAVRKGHLPVARALIRAGADVNAKQFWGASLLATAAGEGRAEMIPLLSEAGLDVNGRDNRGRTPLMDAAEKGHVEAIRALLAAGARVNVVSELDGSDGSKKSGRKSSGWFVDGTTALILAAKGGHAGAVAALLEEGADPAEKDKDGLTAYDWASRARADEVLALLRRAGAAGDRPTVRDLIVAAEAGDSARVDEAIRAGVDLNVAEGVYFTPDGEERGGRRP